MGSKRIQKVDISKDLRDRLLRQALATCGDVLTKSPLELMKLSGCCGMTMEEIFHKCCLAHTSRPLRAIEMLKARDSSMRFFATSLPDLDKVLHGGLPAGTITEVAGPAGCGKTQFCMTLSVMATLHVEHGRGGAVLYIDTEGAFSAKRLLEIAQCKLPQQFSDEESLKNLASRVHIDLVQTCKALMIRLQNIEEDIISKNIKVVVLDSVASLVRKEFSGIQGGMMRRTDFLATEAALLKYIAEAFSIPIIVTNQITTRYGDRFSDTGERMEDGGDDMSSCQGHNLIETDGEGSYMTVALGNTWSHSVNTRLILQYLPGDRRQILVAKSPVAPFSCFDFMIKNEGVVQDVEGQGHYLGTDPGKQAIQGRSGILVQTLLW